MRPNSDRPLKNGIESVKILSITIFVLVCEFKTASPKCFYWLRFRMCDWLKDLIFFLSKFEYGFIPYD